MSDTCDHCGGRVGQYSHGCPGCGAPQCCQLCCTGNHEALRAENERLLGAVQRAYGYLWHVNNEPGAPNQYAPEQAAYAARRELRELLTHEQRGEGINAARAALKDV